MWCDRYVVCCIVRPTNTTNCWFRGPVRRSSRPLCNVTCLTLSTSRLVGAMSVWGCLEVITALYAVMTSRQPGLLYLCAGCYLAYGSCGPLGHHKDSDLVDLWDTTKIVILWISGTLHWLRSYGSLGPCKDRDLVDLYLCGVMSIQTLFFLPLFCLFHFFRFIVSLFILSMTESFLSSFHLYPFPLLLCFLHLSLFCLYFLSVHFVICFYLCSLCSAHIAVKCHEVVITG